MKKIVKGFSALSVLAGLTLVSCGQSNTIKNFSYYQSFIQKPNSFQNFLDNQPIQELLDFVFENKDSKEQFINRTKNIKSEVYKKELNFNLIYYNTINNRSDAPVEGLFSTQNNQPLLYQEAKDNYSQLFNFNWLWFLAHLNQATFIRALGVNDQFRRLEEDSNLRLKNNALANAFYQPTNSVFKNIIIVKGEKEDNNQKYKVFLLNQDNFVFELDVTKTIQNDKVVNTIVALSPWIKIYPKILDIKSLKFPFAEFVRMETNFNIGDAKANNVSQVEKSVFEENLGGDPFFYTLINFKN